MAGILSYGAYVPVWRISRDEIARNSGGGSMAGERAVASRDEDSLTMAVEAGLDCLGSLDSQEIDELYFATTSSPFVEKQGAAIIASALDLRRDVTTCDMTGSLRASVLAVKAAADAVQAGSARKVLVLAADARKARPRSDLEQSSGDGAAALLIGAGDGIARLEGFASAVNAIPGPWKRTEDDYPNVFDARFDTRYGFLNDMPQAMASVMAKCEVGADTISRFALYAPDPRSHMALARAMKLDLKTQLQDIMFSSVGVTGTAHSLLLLVAALERATAGQWLLCAGYGEGSTALLSRATGKIEQEQGKHRGTKYALSGRLLPSYGHFLDFKNEIDTGWPEWQKSSVVRYWRDENSALRLHGMKCRACGGLQYPVSRVCALCGAKDSYEDVRLTRKGKVFSYTHDYLLGPGNVPPDGISPTTRVVVDLEDGCRLWLEMTDPDTSEIGVGTPVELTFRLVNEKSNYRFYGWKARPVR